MESVAPVGSDGSAALAESVVAESVDVESVDVEPVVAEPVVAEPVESGVVAEPAGAEPVVAEPVVAEPAGAGSVEVESVESGVVAEPAVAEPVVAESVDVESLDVEPVVAEPVVAESVESAAPVGSDGSAAVAEPAGAEPVVAEPVVAESVESAAPVGSDGSAAVAEPAGAEPVVAEPVVAEPAGAEPVVAEPVVAESVDVEPVVAESVVAESVDVESVESAAVAEPLVAEPAVAEPVVAEPVVAEPVVAEPAGAEPVESVAPVGSDGSAALAEPVVAESVDVESLVAEPAGAESVESVAPVESDESARVAEPVGAESVESPLSEQPPAESDDSMTGECLPAEPAEPQPEPPAVEQTSAAAHQTQQKPAGGAFGTIRRLLSHRRKPLTIGRSPGSDINDALVPHVHATLALTDAGLDISDEGGSNGTSVNGDRAGCVHLREGDVVTVGNADYRVSGNTLVPRPDAASSGIVARQLGLTVDGNRLVTDVSFSARHGTLTAIIGPPGAAKSALLKLLGGAVRPTSGVVSCDGHDVHTEYTSMRSRIATVPQDDVMHDRLTVEQILGYAAELRLPSDTSAAERRQLVNRVIDELELAPHRSAPAGQLADTERRRVTVAIELLTGPSLVIFGERSFEVDQSLDRQVMMIARRLADAGRVVVVATHSLASLNLCDQVLLLTAKGRTAFVGAPAQMKSAAANTQWSETFAPGNDDHTDAADDAILGRQQASPSATQTSAPIEGPGRPHLSLWRQISMVARRQARLILADRRYLVITASLPFVFGALALAVPGHGGLAGAGPQRTHLDQPLELLVVLSIGAVFMGAALTMRELVAERRIFRRERSVGLSAPAYLAAKVIVSSILAVLQTAILTTIVVIGEGAPARGTVLPREPTVELFLTLLAAAIVSAVVGLALSALAKHERDVLPLFLLVILVSLVFSGGMFPLTERFGVNEISWLVPTRWGLAASASTVDVRAVDPLANHDDLWTHSPRWWAFDMGMLVVSGAAWTALLSWRPRKLRWRPGRISAVRPADAHREAPTPAR